MSRPCSFRATGTCGGPVVRRVYRADDPDLPPVARQTVDAVDADYRRRGDHGLASDARVAIWVCEQHAAFYDDRAVVLAAVDARQIDEENT